MIKLKSKHCLEVAQWGVSEAHLFRTTPPRPPGRNTSQNVLQKASTVWYGVYQHHRADFHAAGGSHLPCPPSLPLKPAVLSMVKLTFSRMLWRTHRVGMDPTCSSGRQSRFKATWEGAVIQGLRGRICWKWVISGQLKFLAWFWTEGPRGAEKQTCEPRFNSLCRKANRELGLIR